MDKTIILDDIKTAHQKSWNKAKKEMPALDLVELIELLTKVSKKQISVYDAAKALSVKYQKPIEIYLDTFAHIEVELVLKHSDIEFVEKIFFDSSYPISTTASMLNAIPTTLYLNSS